MMRWQISFQVRMGTRVRKDDIMVVNGTMSTQSQFLFRIGNDIKESSLCCDDDGDFARRRLQCASSS